MTHFTEHGDPEWLMALGIVGNGIWANQILAVAQTFQEVGYVAGGAARYMLVPGAPEPKDIDVFMYHDLFDVMPLVEGLGYERDEGPLRAPFFKRDKDELRVQVVRPDTERRKTFGPPLGVLSGFTFHTEQAAIWYGTGGVAGLLSVKGRESTVDRVLTNNLISNPILSVYRLNKYGQKGYQVSMETVTEITTVLHRLSADEYREMLYDALSMVS